MGNGVVSKHLTFELLGWLGASRFVVAFSILTNRAEGEAEAVSDRGFDYADDCHF